jgi:hypothetical protein
MAQPVYKLWMAKFTPAWYDLTKEEQDKHTAKEAETMKQAGGEVLMMRVCVWASEEWDAWGVEKFPSIEAAQQYAMALFNLGHYKYTSAKSYLGMDMPQM